MFKLLGAVLIILTSGFIGLGKSNSLKQRKTCLEKIISSLVFLENEIAYGKNDIKTALLNVGQAENLPIFIKTAENLGGSTLKTAFSEAIKSSQPPLSQSDADILSEFSQNLGLCDCQTQISSIRYTKSLLEIQKSDAAAEYAKLGKLYRSMGFLCGILFSVLLF